MSESFQVCFAGLIAACMLGVSAANQRELLSTDPSSVYRIGELLGAGSFGTVYDCDVTRRDERQGAFVHLVNPNWSFPAEFLPVDSDSATFSLVPLPKCAVKVMLVNHPAARVTNNLVLDELRNMTTWDHPNLAKAVDLVQKETYMAIVMPRYGRNLFAALQPYEDQRFGLAIRSQVPEAKAASWIKQLLEALAYLHAHNVSHREVKHLNIFFRSPDDDEHIVLGDFGTAAEFRTSDNPHKQIVCSPTVAAPEVVARSYLNGSVDVWSVGVVAYALLFGEFPYYQSPSAVSGPELTAIQLILRDIKKRKSPRFVSRQNWPAPSPLAIDFVATLLIRDPALRPTAQEMLAHPWLTSSPSAQRFHVGLPARRGEGNLLDASEDQWGSLQIVTLFQSPDSFVGSLRTEPESIVAEFVDQFIVDSLHFDRRVRADYEIRNMEERAGYATARAFAGVLEADLADPIPEFTEYFRSQDEQLREINALRQRGNARRAEYDAFKQGGWSASAARQECSSLYSCRSSDVSCITWMKLSFNGLRQRSHRRDEVVAQLASEYTRLQRARVAHATEWRRCKHEMMQNLNKLTSSKDLQLIMDALIRLGAYKEDFVLGQVMTFITTRLDVVRRFELDAEDDEMCMRHSQISHGLHSADYSSAGLSFAAPHSGIL